MDKKINPDQMNKVLDNYSKKGIDPKLENSLKDRIVELKKEQWLDYFEEKQRRQDQERLHSIDIEIVEANIKNNERTNKILKQKKERKFQLYRRGIFLATGIAALTTVLVKTPLGGKIVDFSKTVIEKQIEDFQQFLDNVEKEKQLENINIYESVYEDTGKTVDELMENSRNMSK